MWRNWAEPPLRDLSQNGTRGPVEGWWGFEPPPLRAFSRKTCHRWSRVGFAVWKVAGRWGQVEVEVSGWEGLGGLVQLLLLSPGGVMVFPGHYVAPEPGSASG
jgi:hypothetical protein